MSISFERIEQFREWLRANGLEKKESPLFEWVEVEPDDSYKQPSKGILCINSDRVLSGGGIIQIINSVLNKNNPDGDITIGEILYQKPHCRDYYFAKWVSGENKCEKLDFNVLKSLGTMKFDIKVVKEKILEPAKEKIKVFKKGADKSTRACKKVCDIYKDKYVLKVVVNDVERKRYDLPDCVYKIGMEKTDTKDPGATYFLLDNRYQEDLTTNDTNKTHYLLVSKYNVDLKKINTTIKRLIVNYYIKREDIEISSNDKTSELLNKCLSTDFMKLFTYKTLKHYISPFVKYLYKDGDDKHVFSGECEEKLANGSPVVKRFESISEECHRVLMNGSRVVEGVESISEEYEKTMLNNDKSFGIESYKGLEKHVEKNDTGHTPRDNEDKLDYNAKFNELKIINKVDVPVADENIWLYRMYKYMSLISKQIKKIYDEKKEMTAKDPTKAGEQIKNIISEMLKNECLIKRETVSSKKTVSSKIRELIYDKIEKGERIICWTDTVDKYTTIKDDVFELIHNIKKFAKDSGDDNNSNLGDITDTILFYRAVTKNGVKYLESLNKKRIGSYENIINGLKSFIVQYQSSWGEYLAYRIAMLSRKGDEKIKILYEQEEKYLRSYIGNF